MILRGFWLFVAKIRRDIWRQRLFNLLTQEFRPYIMGTKLEWQAVKIRTAVKQWTGIIINRTSLYSKRLKTWFKCAKNINRCKMVHIMIYIWETAFLGLSAAVKKNKFWLVLIWAMKIAVVSKYPGNGTAIGNRYTPSVAAYRGLIIRKFRPWGLGFLKGDREKL